jgi:macrolide transport system ATP-binding/permease protein
MAKLRAIGSRIAGLLRARREEEEIAAELDSHLAMQIEDGIRAGLSPQEARRQALIRLGGAEQVRQAWRERSGLPWIENLWRDFRFGRRMLAKNPGFTAAAALTLALGIGANTAIFSLIDALFLKPLPVPHAEQLVRIFAKGPSGHYGAGFSMPEFEQLRAHVTSFSGMAAEDHLPQLNMTTQDGSAAVSGAFVSGNYFDLLGVQPRLGRAFTPQEDAVPNRNAVAIISDDLWKVHFNSDPGILGRQIQINSVLFTVIGVAPAGFQGDLTGLPEEIWIPAMMLGKAGYSCSDGTYNCSLIDAIVGRLAPGVSPAKAEAEAASRIAWSAYDWPERPSRRQVVLFPASGESPDLQVDDLAQMRLLMAVTGSLLLIACANLAGLLLARGATRRREIAVRLAIGARRSRVIRQLLAESLLLASLGGALGVGFSFLMRDLLSQFYATDSEGFHHLYDLNFDWRVLIYAIVVTLLMGGLFGLVPALRASRQDLNRELKLGGPSAEPMGAWLRQSLVIGQVALSMVLVVSAGLLVRSGIDLERGTNFDPAHVVVLRLRPELLKYTPQQIESLVRETVRRVGSAPGVQSVSFMRGGEGLVWNWRNGRDAQVSLPGDRQAGTHSGLTVLKQDIGSDFFHTLHTPLLQGREFSAQDRPDSPRVVVINATLARRLWPSGRAVGQSLLVDGAPFQVAGVAADLQPFNTHNAPEPRLYLSYWQSGSTQYGDIRLAIRVAGDPAAALPAIRRIVQSIDPAVPIGEDMAMSEQVDLEYMPVLLARSVMSYCGLLAITLSAIGLYSILSFVVRTRTREIGIRMALGAKKEDVLRLVAGQGIKLALGGVCTGCIAALLSTKLEAGLLYGAKTADPFVYICVAVLLFVVGLVACTMPALRAASVDPTQALRSE